jgi:hypothetical protein
MTRRLASSTARGLGQPHRRRREALLAQLRDGTPCRKCGQPMIHPKRCPAGPCFLCRLDCGHGVPRMFGGDGRDSALEHWPCNRGEGARLARHGPVAQDLPEW